MNSYNLFLEFELEGFPYAVEEVKNSEQDGSVADDSETSGSKDDDSDDDVDVADEETDTLAPMDVPFIPVEHKEASKHVTKHTKPRPLHKSGRKQQKDKKKLTKAKQSKKEKHSKKGKHAKNNKVRDSKLKLKRKDHKQSKQKHQDHHEHHKHKNKSKYV
jgi:hypothetical protein